MGDGEAQAAKWPTLDDDGYALLPGLLNAPEVSSLRRSADRTMAGPLDTSCERPNNTLIPLRFDDLMVACVMSAEDRVSRLEKAIGATDLKWISGYVSLQEPRSPPLWWHQDWWGWDHPVSYRREPVQVALLCSLSDTDVYSGALRVLPGSHRRNTPLHALLPEAHRRGAAPLDLLHPAMTNHPGQRSLELHAGDAVVVDYRLLHGTHANTGDHRRVCLLLSFVPSWRALPPDVRGHLISHPALPGSGECPSAGGWAQKLLPSYKGPRRDLVLNRNAPGEFSIGSCSV